MLPARSLLLCYCLIVLLCFEKVEPCHKSSMIYKSRRLGNEHVFVREEYQKSYSKENGMEASGPLDKKDLIWSPSNSELVRVDNPGFEFVSENSRWMTVGCRTHLEKLLSFVDAKWPNQEVKIRVLRSWNTAPGTKISTAQGSKTETVNGTVESEDDSNVYYSPGEAKTMETEKLMDAFHQAGRAVDIMVVIGKNSGQRHLGKLAQLAFYSAGFTWCKYTKHGYIHCSVKGDSAMEDVWDGCFHGDSIVNRKFDGPVRISQVNVGDRIQAITADGDLTFSPVVMFLHRDSHLLTEYITLTTESGRQLVLTPDHLIYAIRKTDAMELSDLRFASSKAVFAGSLSPGDLVFVTGGEEVPLQLVVEGIRRIEKFRGNSRGAFAPMTEHGSVMVNGIAASSFSHVTSEFTAKLAMTPYLVYYKIISLLNAIRPKSNVSLVETIRDYLPENDQGVHWYAQFLWNFAKLYLPSGLLYST